MGELLHYRFEAWAAEHPSATALVIPDPLDILASARATRVSFAALDAASEALAAAIAGQIPLPGPPDALLSLAPSPNSVNPFATVGICCRGGSPHGVLCVLAALKAGVPYVPLDPASGAERLLFLITDARVALVVTEDAVLADELSDGRLDDSMPTLAADRFATQYFPGTTYAPSVPACASAALALKAARAPRELFRSPDDAAYVLYTSGSTGTPKGVLGPHRPMLSRVQWALAAYPFKTESDPADVVCHKTALGFVDSIFEILGPLSSGVPLVVAPPASRADPGLLLGLLATYGVTRLILVPSLLRVLIALADDDLAFSSPSNIGRGLGCRLPLLTQWTTSGEALSFDLMESFFRAHPGAQYLLNLYGSTECAADVTGAEFRPEGEDSIILKKDVLSAEDVALVAVRRRSTAFNSIAPIGFPLGGCGVLVLDPDSLQEVPRPRFGEEHLATGEVAPTSADAEGVGEVIVFGRHLAAGYLGRPELTDAAFVWLSEKLIPGPLVANGSIMRRFELLSPSYAAAAEDVAAEAAAATATTPTLDGGRVDPLTPLEVPSGGNPFRCFRTGDFGFLNQKGSLCFVGRRDQMVRRFSLFYYRCRISF